MQTTSKIWISLFSSEMKATIITASLSATIIILFTIFCNHFVNSSRIRGKFDRFATNKIRIHQGHYRHPDSADYYQNPDGAKIIKESHFETEYELGRKIVFICTAIGKPRPHITWFKDGIELYSHNWLQVHEWVESDTRIKSKMEIDPASQMDRGEYECLADNRFAIDLRRFRTDYFEMD